jgi:DNA-binding FadR family transcriptional regulator
MLNAISIKKLQQFKASQIIASQICNAIVRGELTAGDSLPAEGELMETFEVSRPTIREALRILEYEGLVSITRGEIGGRVRQPSADGVARVLGLTLQANGAVLHDVYETLNAIEPSAAAMVAAARPQASMAVLRPHVQRQFEQLDNRAELSRLVSEFHGLLVEQSGNPALAMLCSALHRLVAKHQAAVTLASSDEASKLRASRERACVRSHVRLLDLIEGGRATAAEKHWRQYMAATSAIWLHDVPRGTSLEVVGRSASSADGLSLGYSTQQT